jgi:hypothetical protein
MPTDIEIKQASKNQIGAKLASDSATNLVIPRLAHVEIPPKVNKVLPELTNWHRNNTASFETWREQTNIAINRVNTQTKASLESMINDLQEKIAELQTQIDELSP